MSNRKPELRSSRIPAALVFILAIAPHGAAAAEVQISGSDRLCMAAEFNDIRGAAALLDKGVNPDSRDGLGRTALVTAAVAGHVEMVRFLLARGADVNVPSVDGHTALSGAIANNRREIFQLLLSKGAAVDGASGSGAPLIYACVFKRIEFAKVLLSRGAKANVKDQAGRTPLGVARGNEDNELMTLLVSHGARD
jgi:ankyrin repeat protein